MSVEVTFFVHFHHTLHCLSLALCSKPIEWYLSVLWLFERIQNYLVDSSLLISIKQDMTLKQRWVRERERGRDVGYSDITHSLHRGLDEKK